MRDLFSEAGLHLEDKPQALGDTVFADLFAGGGGASAGFEAALGFSPDYAVNHDAIALSVHQANHPRTHHFNSNVWRVDPIEVVGKNRVGVLWASPDCTHFSSCRGGKPVRKNIRDLAWVVVLWARRVRPQVIFIENVAEFETWGPLTRDQMPCPDRKGRTFQLWVSQLKRLGYTVEWKELVAADYGAPTIRKRLFIVARCDGRPIVWPTPTHAPADDPRVLAGQLLPWRSAMDIIDWSVPCPSIFETSEAIWQRHGLRAKRPLKDPTLRRIARGVVRYALVEKPVVVGDAVPTLIQTGFGERPGQAPRVPGLDKPLGTIVAGGAKHALVCAYMAQHNAGRNMLRSSGRSVLDPVSTLTTAGSQQQVVTMDTRTDVGDELLERACRVSRFVQKYADHVPESALPFGKDGPLVAQVDGQDRMLVDLGTRMLTSREQFRAQGFPEDYQIEVGDDGRPVTKTSQYRLCGNSVSPKVAEALISANAGHFAANSRTNVNELGERQIAV